MSYVELLLKLIQQQNMRTAAYAALIVLAQAVSLEIAAVENSPLLDILAA